MVITTPVGRLMDDQGMLRVLIPTGGHDFRQDWAYPLTSVCRNPKCGYWVMTDDILDRDSVTMLGADVIAASPWRFDVPEVEPAEVIAAPARYIVPIPRSTAPVEAPEKRERARSTAFERTWRPGWYVTPDGFRFTYKHRVSGEFKDNPPGRPADAPCGKPA